MSQPSRKDLSDIEGNNAIANALENQQIATIGRLGSVEANLVRAYFHSEVDRTSRYQAWINAGISYPSNSVLRDFVLKYSESITNLTGLATWPEGLIQAQKEIIDKFLPKEAFTIPLRSLDPIQMVAQGLPVSDVWTRALSGKRVLVIHSFASLIAEQYKKNEILHRSQILPDFDLFTFSPPITNGLTFWRGTYTSNFRKFSYDVEKFVSINKIDIALIAAGSYGMPITARLEKLGVSSIYMGGSLQILFGILGNRWRDLPQLRSSITGEWLMSPTEKRPLGYKLIEKGSYW